MKAVRRDTILITGASSGIGAGLAREFAARGRTLALCARRTERLESVRKQLTSAYPDCQISVHTLDVNQHDEVFRVFNEVRERYGSLDRVIVNAGVGRGGPIGTGAFEANLRIATTDFVAALAQCEAAMQAFRAQNAGHLVMMASTSAFRGVPFRYTAYAAAKAGIVSLAEGIRSDILDTPIKVTTLVPGTMNSELSEGLKPPPFMMDIERGTRLLAKAIEREPTKCVVPRWPWAAIGVVSHWLPRSQMRKLATS